MRLSREETTAAPEPASPAPGKEPKTFFQRHPDSELPLAALMLVAIFGVGILLMSVTPQQYSSAPPAKTPSQLMAASLLEYDVVANGKYSPQDVVSLCSSTVESHGKFSETKPPPEKVSITATMKGVSQTAVTIVCDPQQNTRVIAAYKTP